MARTSTRRPVSKKGLAHPAGLGTIVLLTFGDEGASSPGKKVKNDGRG
jgi:hypothetical protein